MKTFAISALAALAVALAGTGLAGENAPAAAGAAVDVWILSGQSNACGRGRPPGPPASAAVEAFDPRGGKWVPARDPLPGMGTQGVGPWQAAAAEYAVRTSRKVRLAGWAEGGISIDLWDATKGGGWRALSGVLDRAGKGASVFLWYQGEADCGKAPDKYLAQFKDLTDRMRQGCGNPGMTVVVVQLSPFQQGYELGKQPPAKKPLARGDKSNVMQMRETQRRCVLQDGNALLVPAMGRPMQDYWHLSTEGQTELGGEIGRALARHLHKVETGWPGPVLDAAVLGEDGRIVTAHFAEARKLAGVSATDFGIVATGNKSVEVLAVAAKAEASGRTLVKLTFDEPVKLPAALVYGVGNAPAAVLVDEAGNRAPAVQLEIVPGKVPEDKETASPNGAGTAASR